MWPFSRLVNTKLHQHKGLSPMQRFMAVGIVWRRLRSYISNENLLTPGALELEDPMMDQK